MLHSGIDGDNTCVPLQGSCWIDIVLSYMLMFVKITSGASSGQC